MSTYTYDEALAKFERDFGKEEVAKFREQMGQEAFDENIKWRQDVYAISDAKDATEIGVIVRRAYRGSFIDTQMRMTYGEAKQKFFDASLFCGDDEIRSLTFCRLDNENLSFAVPTMPAALDSETSWAVFTHSGFECVPPEDHPTQSSYTNSYPAYERKDGSTQPSIVLAFSAVREGFMAFDVDIEPRREVSVTIISPSGNINRF